MQPRAPPRRAAPDERAEYRDRRVLPGDDVDEGDPDLHRRPIGRTGDRHPPLLGLHDDVVAGTIAVRPEPADREPDRVGPLGEDRVGFEPEACERAAAVVVDDDVGALDQAREPAPGRLGVARSAVTPSLLRLMLRK